MIKAKTIEQVKDLPVKDVLECYGVTFKRVGAYYMGCCPIHGERNPSLAVKPATNSWRCFSCKAGGSGIDFVMAKEGLSFSEAVIELAKTFNIEIQYDKKERTEEEREAHRKAESMRAALQVVQEFYVAQIEDKTEEAQIARQYRDSRWDADFCKDIGIGYAPKDSSKLLAYCQDKCISKEILISLGVIKQNKDNNTEYALLRQRLTIPIRDRYRRVIGFTARYIGDNKDVAKYMNSTDSDLFHKHETVFGLDVAARQARLSNFFLMVEGAPDVLRLQSIGLTEAVAPLGTALTAEHLDKMRQVCRVIRFIPDSDAPKNNLYGAGVMAVMKNGRLAMEKGFEVSVREIPRTAEDDANGVKRDPDSYILTRDDYNSLEDETFVVWYARKRFAGADAQNLQMEVVAEVASLLILIEDDLTREMCIDKLTKIFGKAKMWRDAMRRAGQKLREEANSSDNLSEFTSREVELLRANGIIIKDGCYQSPDKDGNLARWSNFIFRPILHIKDPSKSTRILRIINQDGEEEVIEFASADFVSPRNFCKKLIDRGNYVWRTDESSALYSIQEYIFGVTASALKIQCLGWNPYEDYFAFSNGMFIGGQFIKADKLGVVQYGTKRYFLPACSELYADNEADFSFERLFEHREGSGNTLYRFAEQLGKVYGDGGRVGLAWVLASCFRDIIFNKLRSFPMLNLFGRKGSGKTELAKALASFFYVLEKTPSSCTNTTIPSIAYMLSHAKNAVVILDEFTNDLKTDRIDIIKGIWGGTSQSKMNMEDKRPMTIPVTAAVILGGQYKPEDEAIFSRCIHLQYATTSFSQEETREFDKLQEMALQGNSHILMDILKLRRIFEKGFASAWDMTVSDVAAKIHGMGIEERIRKNWIVPLAAFRVLEAHIEMPYTYKELFDIVVAGMKFQNDQITKSSETADFWLFLDSMHTQNKVREKCHYVIKTQSSFRALGADSLNTYVNPKRILYLNFRAVRSLLEQRFSKPKSGNTLSIDTLESYLKTLPQYLGRKQQRFQLMRPNGELDEEYHTENGVSRKYVNSNLQKAMCFDYDALNDALDLSLESIRFEDFETKEQEPDEGLPTNTDTDIFKDLL